MKGSCQRKSSECKKINRKERMRNHMKENVRNKEVRKDTRSVDR